MDPDQGTEDQRECLEKRLNVRLVWLVISNKSKFNNDKWKDNKTNCELVHMKFLRLDSLQGPATTSRRYMIMLKA
jgi:hypothetical protein